MKATRSKPDEKTGDRCYTVTILEKEIDRKGFKNGNKLVLSAFSEIVKRVNTDKGLVHKVKLIMEGSNIIVYARAVFLKEGR